MMYLEWFDDFGIGNFGSKFIAFDFLKLGVEDFLIKNEVSSSTLYKSIEFAFSRRQYIEYIQSQIEKLKRIAWTQSHVVWAPLSRMLGIINLIEAEKENLEDLMFWLNQLRDSSDELDSVIRKISEEAQEIEIPRNKE